MTFLLFTRARSPLLTTSGRIPMFAVEMMRRVNRGESQTGPSPALGNPHQTRVPTFPQRRRRRAAWQRQGPTPRKIRAPYRFLHRTQKREAVFQACRHASMIRVASIVLLLVIAVLCSDQDPPSTIKVDVKLVNVFVTVTDERGAPVGNLTRENFDLNEDGREQKITLSTRNLRCPCR